MKSKKPPLTYEVPPDSEILRAYLHKNTASKRSDIRRIRRALRKLAHS